MLEFNFANVQCDKAHYTAHSWQTTAEFTWKYDMFKIYDKLMHITFFSF